MVLMARDGQAPSLFDLLVGCLEYGGYREDRDGQIKGLFYEPFTRFARDRFELHAEVITNLGGDRLVQEVLSGNLVIASVHKEIRRPERQAPGVGGHLVLVIKHQNGQFTFHNPSGHTPEAGVATLPVEIFDRFAAHRGISVAL
jgi:hypothetical protein